MTRATTEAAAVATDAAAVATQYDDKAAPGYVAPPAGMRYVRQNGKVIIGQDGKPVTAKSKKTGKRNKAKKPTYAVPTGGLPSSDVPGYDINVHAKLKAANFADPLDAAKFDVWYYEQRVAEAKKGVERISALGATVEERKEASEDMRAATALENLLKRRTGPAKGRLAELLGKLYAESQTS